MKGIITIFTTGIVLSSSAMEPINNRIAQQNCVQNQQLHNATNVNQAQHIYRQGQFWNTPINYYTVNQSVRNNLQPMSNYSIQKDTGDKQQCGKQRLPLTATNLSRCEDYYYRQKLPYDTVMSRVQEYIDETSDYKDAGIALSPQDLCL